MGSRAECNKTYTAHLPLLVLGDPLRLSGGRLDQVGLLGVEDDVIDLGRLQEAGGDGGDAGGEERSLGELHGEWEQRASGL